MPTAPEQVNPAPPAEMKSAEIPFVIQDHEAELTKIKKFEPEARLPEEDTVALKNFLEGVMKSGEIHTEIGFKEDDPNKVVTPQKPKKPVLSAIVHNIADFFPRIIQDTVEDARMTIRRRTWRETPSSKPLQIMKKKGEEFGQVYAEGKTHAELKKEEPPVKGEEAKPEPIAAEAVQISPQLQNETPSIQQVVTPPSSEATDTVVTAETVPSKVVQFPSQEKPQNQPAAETPTQIAA